MKEIVSTHMKKIIPLIMIASVGALASPVKADLTSRFTSSVQLQVNAAATQMQRVGNSYSCLLYTSPSPRDKRQSRMPSSA